MHFGIVLCTRFTLQQLHCAERLEDHITQNDGSRLCITGIALKKFEGLTSLIPPHNYVCPKQGLGFPTSYIVVFFMFNDLRWEVIVRFIDICRIVDYH